MKFKSQSQTAMWWTSVISLCVLIISQILCHFYSFEIISTIRTTALTVFYHFAVRLICGECLFEKFMPANINYNGAWFRIHSWEMHLYKKLNVKKWKEKLPTYNNDEFSIKKHSVEEIVRASCKAELIHEVNVGLSFVPLLFSIKFGALPVFFNYITSGGFF